MYLFEDQKFFLSVLRQTDFIRPDQALPLLRLFDPRKTQGQTEALIRQLRYAGELGIWLQGTLRPRPPAYQGTYLQR